MAAYLIALELISTQPDNPKLCETIKGLSNDRWHHFENIWIMISPKTGFQIRDELKQCLEEEDKLLVLKLNGDVAWSGLPESGSNWIKQNL